jgi:lysophospholipase L1-like esterase
LAHPDQNSKTKGVGTRKAAISEISTRFFAYVGYVIFSLVVAAILLETGSRVAMRGYRHFHRSTVTSFSPDNPAYSAYSWSPECMQDQRRRQKAENVYFPYRLWGVTEWHGECRNNDVTALGAVRRTINPSNPACAKEKKTNVWLLGGSAVYGTYIPDWATLPSYLSAQLNTPSRCTSVTNLGVEGYVTNQDILLLMEKLKGGKVPDVVILYDGFNDSAVGTREPGPTTHMGFQTVKGRFEGSMTSRLDFLQRPAVWQLAMELSKPLRRKGPSGVPPLELLPRAAATLDNYESNLRIARMLGQAYGFTVCAFWQPAIIYGHKQLTPYEKQVLDLSYSEAYPFQSLSPVYKEAAYRAGKKAGFTFLGDVFEAVREPIYLDWVHLNPRGNELVAREVAKHLQECMPSPTTCNRAGACGESHSVRNQQGKGKVQMRTQADDLTSFSPSCDVLQAPINVGESQSRH